MEEKAAIATHSTSEQAGAFARQVNARSLVLTHFSARQAAAASLCWCNRCHPLLCAMLPCWLYVPAPLDAQRPLAAAGCEGVLPRCCIAPRCCCSPSALHAPLPPCRYGMYRQERGADRRQAQRKGRDSGRSSRRDWDSEVRLLRYGGFCTYSCQGCSLRMEEERDAGQLGRGAKAGRACVLRWGWGHCCARCTCSFLVPILCSLPCGPALPTAQAGRAVSACSSLFFGCCLSTPPVHR